MIRRLALISLMSVVLIGGCGDAGDYLSALSKLASNVNDPPIGNLTAAELAALTNHKADLAGLLSLSADQVAAIPTLTVAQAQIIVSFMDDNNITTISQLQALADEIANGNPNNIEIPEELEALVQSMGF